MSEKRAAPLATGGLSKRAVLYYRVSTGEQTCDNQVADLRRYCEFRKWTVAGEFQDDAVSGLKKSRPGLDAMMKEIRQGKYNVLLVWSYDRLARNVAHLMMTLDELKSLSVDFASYRQQLDTTSPMGHMMFTVFAGFAQLERDMISERTKASLARLRAEGKTLGRPRESDSATIEYVKYLRGDDLSIRAIALAVGKSVGWVHGILKEANANIPA